MSIIDHLYHSLFPHPTKHKRRPFRPERPSKKTILNDDTDSLRQLPRTLTNEASMDTFQRFKDRLLEQYQKDPKFHAIVDRFHYSVRNGDITFDALFGAIFLAKEIFITNQEDRIYDDIKYSKEK